MKTISIPSDTSLVIGFIVEKGYDVSMNSGTVYMGTEDTPHAVGASLGTWKEFEAANGVVTIRLENASAVATRLAIYTKPGIYKDDRERRCRTTGRGSRIPRVFPSHHMHRGPTFPACQSS